MTLTPTSRASIWDAWHDDDAAGYDGRVSPVPTEAERRAAIADRIAAASSAVAYGHAPLHRVSVAIWGAFHEVDRAMAAGRDDIAEVLAEVLADYGLDADDIMPAPLSDDLTPAADEYRAADTTLTDAGRVPFPTTARVTTRQHRGRQVRGRRRGVVIIGAMPAGIIADADDIAASANLSPRARRRVLRSGMTYGTMRDDDALAIADSFDDVPARLGTDDASWSQVIVHKPERFSVVTNDGRQVMFSVAPDGAGESIVGAGDLTGAPAKRRRAPYVMTMPTYRLKPETTTERTDADGRVWRVSHYRTTHHGRFIIAGDGRGWQETTRAKRTRTTRPAAPVVTRDHAADAFAALGMADGRAYRLRYVFPDGTTAAIYHEPDARRWRVAVTVRQPDGSRTRSMTTARKLSTAVARVRDAAVSAPPVK